MTAWGFGWRTTVMAWTVLTLALIALGGVASLFDANLGDPVPARLGAGLFGGAWIAAVFAPVILVVAASIGLVRLCI